jgi:hypothetical protein
MKILAVSDEELSLIYSPQIAQRFPDLDLVIGCGDLPYYYLEYIISMLDVPCYFVRGNHASQVEIGADGERSFPWGAVDLHRRVARDDSGLLLAGIEGSIRYNKGEHQYTQAEMWMAAFLMTPYLFLNKLHYGRYLDILVTHAPPWRIHDMTDLPHNGARAFNWLIRVFKPLFHLHGHVHIYRSDTIRETQVERTRVINTFGYRLLEIGPREMAARSLRPRVASRRQ